MYGLVENFGKELSRRRISLKEKIRRKDVDLMRCHRMGKSFLMWLLAKLGKVSDLAIPIFVGATKLEIAQILVELELGESSWTEIGQILMGWDWMKSNQT